MREQESKGRERKKQKCCKGKTGGKNDQRKIHNKINMHIEECEKMLYIAINDIYETFMRMCTKALVFL